MRLEEVYPELAIEVIKPSRPGGQYVGVSIAEVKVTHIPTGLTASCGGGPVAAEEPTNYYSHD